MNNIQQLLSQLSQRMAGQLPQQKKDRSKIFQQKSIVLPKNLSNFEKEISNLLSVVFSCKECFNTSSEKEDLLCDGCQLSMKKLQEVMLSGIFETKTYREEQKLQAFQKTGSNIKVYCGKILKAKDVGYKCYDCEMDPTCIICKECFEKGDHRGHRTVVQKGCSGCCDCGDIEAWKKEKQRKQELGETK